MKRFACTALLAAAFVTPAAAAQESNAAKAQKEGGQASARAEKQKAREARDCDTNRAGVRCSRPKPKKVWFFGKA